MADLYVSPSKAADILDVTVAAMSRLLSEPTFPRKYSFDVDAIKDRPAIKRGPFFRFDEILQWKQRAGEFGNCDPPPGQKETAVPAGTGHDGISEGSQENHTLADANKQGTPCHKCQWLYGGNVRARGRWWSACSLTATRDPGVRCSYFLDGNRGAADG